MVKPVRLNQVFGMSQKLRTQIGGRLKVLREGRALTQQQLAERLGKSIETISNFERGKTLPSLVTLEQLARALNASMKDFFESERLGSQPKQSKSFQRLKNAVSVLQEDDLETLAELATFFERRQRRA